jgi:hypothetical protein
MSENKSEPLGSGFNRLWSASILSNLADGVLAVAAPLLAITLTKDPVLIALLSAMISLPWLFFAIPIPNPAEQKLRREARLAAR